jgi:uncharacterized protein
MESGVPGMIFERSAPVAMSDGVQLRINIYRPETEGRYPVVMIQGPYTKDAHLKDLPFYREAWKHMVAKNPDLLRRSSGRFIRWEAVDPERWVPDGYVVIHADARGSGASPGYLDRFAPREIEDFATLITWASRQVWSNGKVGLLGISYYAISQWQVAARQPEGLAAIIPWEGAFDHYRELSHHGGIFSNAFMSMWFTQTVVSAQHGNGQSVYMDAITGERVTGSPISPDLLAYNRADLTEALRAQPFDGAFYHQRTPDGSRIKAPLLSVGNWGGLGLHGHGNIGGYLAAGSEQKWLRIHSGDHVTPFYEEEALALQKRFFGQFLNGEDNGWDREPPIALLIRRPDGARWRHETEWPLKDTQWERYYLDASEQRMATGAVPQASEASFDALGDGLTFQTAPFVQETEFTGPMKARLWVKSSTADMDIFLTLRLIDPAGKDVTFVGASEPRAPVTQGWLRASHRALDEKRSTEWQPFHPHLANEPLTPGELYEVDVEIWASCIVAPPGYRLALSIQGKDWEWPDSQNMALKGSGPFLHTGRDPALYGGRSTLATGTSQASYLLLPRIPTRSA